MVNTNEVPPSAKQLLARLVVPPPMTGGGLEGAGVEVETSSTSQEERLETSRQVLKKLASQHNEVNEEVVDRIIGDAGEALRKLDSEGDGAELAPSEAFGLEAVIETDGSRPVLFVQDGTIDLNATQLRASVAKRWRVAAEEFQKKIETVVSAVGGVQLPAFKNKRLGTAFAIAPGLIVTNRHVLEEIARFEDGRWEWKFDAEVDFKGEHERPGTNVFKLKDVLLWGPNSIDRRINFANLDLAVIRVEGNDALFPKPLTLEKNPESVTVDEHSRPAIYVVGFPAEPLPAPDSPNNPPPAGHEYQEVVEKLFEGRFGKKRWAPGLVEAGAGQLAGDARRWVMSHDSSTLAGNSGSCIVNFSNNGERVVGLHFGGRARVENYAHVVAALQQELAEITGISWMSE